MNIFKKKKTESKPEFKPVLIEKIIFNVDNFNHWFCDGENNNAIYANSGIFGRIDKLSESHVDDYLDKCFNINPNNPSIFIFSEPLISLKYNLYKNVLNDWKHKQK